MNNFNKTFSTVACCSGVLLLDELTMAAKFRSRARECLPNKPDPHGLRFCGLPAAGPNSSPCLFSIVSDRSGDHSGAHMRCCSDMICQRSHNENMRVVNPQSSQHEG